jgi:3-oxoacyl-[acyl-carrier protein] reductase
LSNGETPAPSRRPPEDVANTIALLVSEDASFVSNQVIYVADGARA